MSNKMKPFDAMVVPLTGQNLIEASAGTGKTYSIAILVLRLLLEEEMPVEQIVMVTFTNDAVAELSGRVRAFVTSALGCVKHPQQNKSIDPHIVSIVKKALKEKGTRAVYVLLKQAAAFLDDTAIYTIHSFCHRVLTEYAFETGQIFQAEVMTDMSELIVRAVNTFWRKELNKKSVEEMQVIYQGGFNRENLLAAVRKTLNGKSLDESLIVHWDDYEKAQQEWRQYIEDEKKYLKKCRKDIESFLQLKQKYLKPAQEYFSRQLEQFTPSYLGFEQLGAIYTTDKKVRAAVEKQFVNSPLIDYYENLLILEEDLRRTKRNYADCIYKQGIEFCTGEVIKYKHQYAVRSQQDLIDDLFTTSRNSESAVHIRQALSRKYRALFIDEFQDTDYRQYTIFSTLMPDAITFFIGDPKQAIYGFRGADLDTYLDAAYNVDAEHRYTMKHNFRSTSPFVTALNFFFSVDSPFLKQNIEYVNVKAGIKNMGNLEFRNKICTPFTIVKPGDKKDEVKSDSSACADITANLLSGGYTINGEPLDLTRYSIGILVRTNREGQLMKRELTRRGIPAVLKQEYMVLQSEAAREFLFFLEALLDPGEQSVKKVLLSNIFSSSPLDVAALDEETMISQIEFFKGERNRFEKTGIYGTCRSVIAALGLKKKLLSAGRDRDLANILQIAELLHRRQQQGAGSLEELVDWIYRIREGEIVTGDEYEERIESDDAAVQIVTVHKSKGLAYDIVIAPFLNMSDGISSRWKILDFKEEGRDLFTLNKNNTMAELSAGLICAEENRRILYVALTRARYKVFLCFYGREGTLNQFISGRLQNVDEQDEELSPFFETIDSNSIPDAVSGKHEDSASRFTSVPARECTRKLPDISYTGSFSSINAQIHTPSEIIPAIPENVYDEFVFSRMPRGTAAGTFLHELFEHIDFSVSDTWKPSLERTVYNHRSLYESSQSENYLSLINHTVGANLQGGFSLSSVPQSACSSELPFYFSATADTGRIQSVLAGHGFKDIQVRTIDLQGAMTGVIDLIIEHAGRYYILDWKSNHLGSSLDNYDERSVAIAMTDNNYHLQYLLYSVALKRILQNNGIDFKEAFGGVFYLFLRGLRSGSNSGVFFAQPQKVVNAVEDLETLFG